MTSQQPAQTEPEAAQGTMAFNGLDRILGAAWIEPTVLADKGTERQLIAAQQEANDPSSSHRLSLIKRAEIALRRAPLEASAAARRHITTRSTFGRRLRCVRKASRTRRLIRLRSTASGAARFEIASPSRAPGSVLVAAALGQASTVK